MPDAPKSFVQVQPDSTGKKVGTRRRIVDGVAVEEQVVILTDGHGNDIAEFIANRLPVDVDGSVQIDGTVEVEQSDADNTSGSVTAVAIGDTVTIVSFTAAADFKFEGFIVSGNADGEYFIELDDDGIKRYAVRTTWAQPSIMMNLPSPDASFGGKAVTLKVKNLGVGPAEYEATILGT